MPARRDQLLDAAIEVVGTRGLRALTHRAVDAQADLGAGSTSNLFRRRQDLVAGMLERLLERETAAWTDPADPAESADPAGPADPAGDVVALLADRVRLLTGPLRPLTVARFALFGEAAVDESLRTQIADSRAAVARRVRDRLGRSGLPVDDAVVSTLLSTLNGLLVERLAMPPGRAPDPAVALRGVLAPAARPAGAQSDTTRPSAEHSATACGVETIAPAR